MHTAKMICVLKFQNVKKSIDGYLKLIKKYKIKSIEDPFSENDWKAWSNLLKKEKKVQIVGDDLYVTNLQRLIDPKRQLP